MSLFGTSPPDESPSMHSSFARSRASLFEDDDSMTASQTQSASNSLFQDDGSPWDMPAPRRQKSRADLLRGILPAADAPDSYIETFDAVVREEGSGGKVSFSGLSRVLAAARLDADAQAHIAGIVAPAGSETALGRNEFNVLLALVGLAQEGETVTLDSVDERRRSEFPLGFLCRSMHTARPVSLRIPHSPSPPVPSPHMHRTRLYRSNRVPFILSPSPSGSQFSGGGASAPSLCWRLAKTSSIR